MRKFRVLFLLGVLSLMNIDSNAQQDAQWSHYMFNSLYYNPGSAGIEGVTRFNFISRTQWLGYSGNQTTSNGSHITGGSPNTQILSVNSPIPPIFNKRLQHGAGFYMLYDTKGPLRNLDFQFSYAPHFKLGKGVLGTGVRVGFTSQKILGDQYVVNDPSDPIYQILNSGNGRITKGAPDFAAGLWYKTNKYYGGISFDHLSQSKLTYARNGIAFNTNLANHMYITGGYNFDMGLLRITPSALIQTDLNELSYIFGGLVTYNNKFWAGLNLRQSFAHRDESKKGKTFSNDDIVMYVGFNFLKNGKGEDALRLGYSFDFVTSGLSAKARTSHEIMLSYMMASLVPPPKPKVRTPRYRHDEN
jgi:type IX secretion system PorP/SprF family membrane protein